MVEGKYTKVYPQTLSTTPAPVSSKSVDKLDSYLKEHPLISVLEKHKVVTLHFTIGISSMFKYDEYNRGMIDGTCLITSHPVGFNIESIKEAWSIVDGKYTKIWEKQLSQAPVSSPPMDKLASYFEAQNNVKNACEKVNNTLEKLNNSFDKVFKSIDKEEPIKQKITSGRAYTRYPSSEIKTDTFYKDGKFHGDYLEYHENGNIKTKAFYQDGKLNGDYYEYFNDGSCSKFIEYKNGLKNGVYIEYGRNDKGFQVSFHKYFKDDVEVTVQKNII
jgi:antitoxin component YwqK of YwqJK toxin-antitoxin module